MASAEIAAELGLPLQQVYNIVHRYGLAEIRAKNEKRALARAEDIAVAEAEEFVASITPQAMEAAEHGFALARTEDAKEFAMAMKGTQIAVQIARQGLGLDAKGCASGHSASLTVIFGAPFEDATEKHAEPVDVSTTTDTEIEFEFDQSQKAENHAPA
jgi:hypothetical protein